MNSKKQERGLKCRNNALILQPQKGLVNFVDLGSVAQLDRATAF